MLYLNIPVGGAYGWGVCGKSIAREMAKLTPTRLLTSGIMPDMVGDELELATLQKLLPSPEELQHLAKLLAAGASPQTPGEKPSEKRLDGPLLQLANKQLEPMTANLRGERTVGYTFFEDTELLPRYIENANHFDQLAAGSTWCADILRRHGLKDVAVVIQGVDPEIFYPHEASRRFFTDRFVIFSGGKFEFRKGHDLVVRAFKVMSDRHADVMLVTSWFNAWDFSYNSMRQSKHIRFTPVTGQPKNAAVNVLAENGVDMQRVIALGMREPVRMADAYRNTDVGLFPNRAEGGTNLVLMEYMACGKPAIATACTGHADIVTADNALTIATKGEIRTSSDGMATATWPEPSLDDTIDKLEWAYQNRDALKPIADRGAESMRTRTWTQTAKAFLAML